MLEEKKGFSKVFHYPVYLFNQIEEESWDFFRKIRLVDEDEGTFMTMTEKNLLKVFTSSSSESMSRSFRPLANYQGGSIMYDCLCVGKNDQNFIIALSIKDVPVGFSG